MIKAKTSAKVSDAPLAWIVSDKNAERQSVLQTHWYTTSHFHHDLHSKGHLSYLLQRIQQQRPSLLWVRLAGPVPGSGNKCDAQRTLHLCALVQAHAQHQGFDEWINDFPT